jgi:large subunit ribosomal protein L25
MPGKLPEAIEVDVSGLEEVDQTIYARDLELPDGVTLLDPPEELIVKVQLTKAAIEPEVEAAEEAEEAPAIGEGTPAEEVGQDADAPRAETKSGEAS